MNYGWKLNIVQEAGIKAIPKKKKCKKATWLSEEALKIALKREAKKKKKKKGEKPKAKEKRKDILI